MTQSKRKWLITLVVIVLLGIIFSVLKHKRHQKPANAVTVSVVTAIQKNLSIPLSAVGNVEPMASVAVTARVDGELIDTYVNEGADVKAGQLLFQIDPRSYEVQLEMAKANLARDQALLANAETTLARNQALVKGGYVAAQQFDTFATDAASKKAIVAADQASVDDAALQLGFTSIHAPISGRTGAILVKPGNLIKSSNSQTMVQINQLSPIYVRFTIPEKKLSKLRQVADPKALPVTVTVGGKTVTRETGHLSFIDNQVDSTTGQITLKATFPNKNLDLWPGEFARVSFPIQTLPNAILIPTRAVQEGQQGSYVFVVDADDIARLRLIKVGPAVGDFSVIHDGLKAGETVVLEGQLRLTDGTPVNVEK